MTRSSCRGPLVIACFLLVSIAGAAPAPQDRTPVPEKGAPIWLATPGDADRIKRVEANLPTVPVSTGTPIALTVEGWMRAYNVPGISVAVFDDFRVVWAKAYGVKEAGATAPVTLDTLFQAGSISKPVAAMAAMHFVERGRFSLDEDINAKLVSWKVPENEFTRTEKVTLRRLLSHNAGLTVHGFPGYAVTEPVPTVVQVLDGAKPANTAPVRVDMAPGTKFRYSGGGTTVVQLALVDQLGKPFAQILDETVFSKIGLTNSTYQQPLPPDRAAQAASGHRRDGKVVEGRWHVYPEMAAAGLWTTPWDLAQVAIEVARSKTGRSNRVLSRDSVRLMLTPQAGEAGLGFFVDASGKTDRFGHEGADEGFQAVLDAFAATGRGVVMMMNSDNGMAAVQPLLDSIAREYQWPGHVPWVTGVVDTVWLVSRTKGLDAGLVEYRRMRDARPAADFRPAQLNSLGYQLLGDGRVEDAVRVFQLNVELYPQDANAYDSLGEAHMAAGRSALAIANYRKSLELDPQNENAVTMLRKLGGERTPAEPSREVSAAVTRMAKVGRAGSPTFSPDGQRLAFVSDLNGTPQVWVVAAGGGWPTLLTADTDPVGAVRWSPAGHWLAYTSAPGGGMNTQVHVVRPDGTGQRRLTRGGKETNRLFDWTRDGRRLAIGSNVRTPSAIDAYLVDPATAAADIAVQNEALATLEDVSRDGRVGLVSRLVSRGDNNLYLVDLATRRETLVTPHTGPGTFSGRLAPDARTVYLLSNKDRDLLAFARVRVGADGSVGPIEVLAERPDAELDGFELDNQGTQAALLWNVAGRNELAFLDLASGRTTRGPELPGEIAGGPTFSRDGQRLAITISGAAAPPDVWILDLASRAWRQVTHSPHAGVDLSQLVRPELVKFKAHDGLELSGWLYRPTPQAGAGAYVISFHGGPEGQERPSFRSDYQALVAAGIGVFAPNVRGSSGFGKRFVNLDNGELRFNGLKDIKACVDYLVSGGIADPRRIGITGGSYGGYMTLVGVTEYPDLFAAGAKLFGMVNFFTFFEHTEPWMAAISTVEYGDPKTQGDLLRALSPLGKLDRIRAPLMVQHGANDTNVPVIEAEQVVENLKKRGVPVEYILFPDEGHGWRKITNRVRSTVALVEFFSRHLSATASSR